MIVDYLLFFTRSPKVEIDCKYQDSTKSEDSDGQTSLLLNSILDESNVSNTGYDILHYKRTIVSSCKYDAVNHMNRHCIEIELKKQSRLRQVSKWGACLSNFFFFYSTCH